MKRSYWIPSVFGAMVVLIVWVTTFVIHIKADDIWWHLKTGEYIIRTLTLPDLNIFSFTAPEHHWLPHEWLSEVVFYLVYHYLGYKALILFGMLLNTFTCVLVYRLTDRYTRSPLVSSIITLVAGLMVLGNYSLRPYLFGNLFFVLCLNAMEEPNYAGRLRLAMIFLLFSTWANFHGSFIIGLGLIFLYFVASVTQHVRKTKRSWAKSKSLALEFLVAVIASAFTPHHVYGLIFPLTYVQNAFSGKTTYLTNISEWQSAGINTPLGRMIIFYVMFCLFAIFGSAVGPSPIHIGLLVAFSFFAYASIRNIPLLGIAATPILARHLPRAMSRVLRIFGENSAVSKTIVRYHDKLRALENRSAKVLLVGVLALVLLIVFVVPNDSSLSYASQTKVASLADLSPSFYPKGLLQELKKRKVQRVFNYFNWGGAIIYELFPSNRVFIDQRNDCYPNDVFLDYFAVHELSRGWRYVLRKWNIDAVAYPKDQKLTKKLRSDIDWIVTYEDDQAVLFVRLDPEPWSSQPR